MNVHEVAAAIIASSHIRTAFDISAALDEVRQQLLMKFTDQLLGQLPCLSVAGNCGEEGLRRAVEGRPFLMRRVVPGSRPGPLPWGEFAIGLAFDHGRLFCGIHYDTKGYPAGNQPAPGPGSPANSLKILLPGSGRPRECWPCWQWAGPSTERELYSAMAENVTSQVTSTLVEQLKPEIEKYLAVLDLHCHVTTP